MPGPLVRAIAENPQPGMIGQDMKGQAEQGQLPVSGRGLDRAQLEPIPSADQLLPNPDEACSGSTSRQLTPSTSPRCSP
jgi:hypothetical protein